MSTFPGTPVTVPVEIKELYGKIANVEGYQALLDKVPDEMKSKMRGLSIKDGRVMIESPGVGTIELVLVEQQSPGHVAFEARNAPVPVRLVLDLEADGYSGTTLRPSIEAEIPAMLKPFLGARLQEGSTMLGKAFSQMFS